MTEKVGYYRFGSDGAEEYVEAEAPDGTTQRVIDSMANLPKPEPFILINPKAYALLRGKP